MVYDINAASEFPLTYQRGRLRGLIDEDLVPGGVGIALNYPPLWGDGKSNGIALNSPL